MHGPHEYDGLYKRRRRKDRLLDLLIAEVVLLLFIVAMVLLGEPRWNELFR